LASLGSGEGAGAGEGASKRAIDSDAAIRRLIQLLEIPGPTGEEGAVADHVVHAALEAGVPAGCIRRDDAASRIPLPCQCGNLIIVLPGTAPGPRRLLSAHLDTVPLARGARPVIEGERIVPAGPTALGGDDRTGVAALLTALCELRRSGAPHPPLTFLFSVREESGLRGAAAVRPEDLAHPEMGFNFDGGSPEEVTIGATGAVRLDIEVRGIAAHAGVHPERGVSAIAIFAAAAARLERGGWLGLVQKPEGAGTSNIGVVQGGDATNVVTDWVHARAEARSHDPVFLRRLVEEYRRAFAEEASVPRSESGAGGEATLDTEESYASFRLSGDHPAVLAASDAIRAIGLAPRTRISNGGLDANQLTAKGIPTATLGCGQHEIHTVKEYVLIPEYLSACRIASQLTR
jgi:tripeptide aminopeptidase